jgi:uncharacterized repeat protein (TIGR03803 family)
MNTILIKPHHEQFFVNFVALCKAPLWIAGLGLVLADRVTAQTLTTLYSFTPSFVSYGGMSEEYFTNGANPLLGLAQASDGYFYGATSSGGLPIRFNGDGYGTMFKISTDGALTSLYSFTGGNDGAEPEGLVQGSDGNFYGTTGGGGTSNLGTVFKISTNGVLTSLYSFTGGTDGDGPGAGLVQGSDGNFYGTTLSTFFQMTPAGVLTTLVSDFFSSALVQGSDGYFYGTTGASAIGGTVFKISTNGALTTLHSFTGGNDGAGPNGLVQGSDGSFYGTTYGGGQDGGGTVFRLTIVPEFQAVTLTNDTLNVTWSTEAGGTYQLQYASDLTSTNWIDLQSAFVATGPSMTTSDFVPNTPQRFYRLRIIFGLQGAFDCVVSGPQPDYYSFLNGLQALSEAYGLEYTLQSLLGGGGGSGLYDVMTLDPNGCVIAYCNANPQWGCFLGQTSSDCTIASGPELPAGLPVIAWGAKAPCSGEHVFQW